MSNICVVCKKKMGGILGHDPVDEKKILLMQELGCDVPFPICVGCISSYQLRHAGHWKRVCDYIENNGTGPIIEFSKEKKQKIIIPDIDIFTFNPYSCVKYDNFGLVTAHVALGTGPLSALFSTFSDFFGEESESYNLKMQQSTSACLDKLKINAHKIGATQVIGVQVTYGELTAGQGMVMVCMAGTAIKPREVHGHL